MAEDRSLLAYLVPKITNRREDTATDALAFILNKSEDCRKAFNDLLRGSGYELEPVGNFRTQVTYEDGSRPDMVGYDKKGAKRLIVESKFWASLRGGQTKGYLDQLEDSGPGVLLFIAPGARMETLWAEIRRRMEEVGLPLESVKIDGQMRTAKIADTGKRLMLVSWLELLDRLAKASSAGTLVEADIRQLRGLAVREDEEAFQPIGDAELSPSVAQRLLWLNRLIDDAIMARGVKQGWMSVEGLQATPRRQGYGRRFKFPCVKGQFFLRVYYRLWATKADTPLWLRIGRNVPKSAAPPLEEFTDRPAFFPIYLKTGVEYEDVLDDVARQIKEVYKAFQSNKK